jgi:hypothetical protein
MGAAFAMVWRPMAILRGPVREKSRQLDVLAGFGLLLLAVLMWKLKLSEIGHNTGIRFDPWLFRGGFFWTGLATLMVIAAVTHQRALMGRALGNPVLNYIGTRSYGLYLYHWPIYQIIRGQAGVPMSGAQWLWAMVITVPVTEASYRYIELPIRQGRLSEWMRGERRPRTAVAYKRRQRLAGLGIVSAALVGFAGVSIAMANNECVGQVECDSIANQNALGTDPPIATDPVESLAPSTTDASVQATGGVVGSVQTVAPTTQATTTTVPALQDKPVVAFGESVMLGAATLMEARGIRTYAEVSAGPNTEMGWFQLALQHYNITYGVVIQLGTNGTVTRDQYEAMLAMVPAGIQRVVVLTVHADRPWIAGNNEIIRSLPQTHPNVVVLDWEQAAEGPDFAGHLSGDHIHLKDDMAKQAYTKLILTALGLPT